MALGAIAVFSLLGAANAVPRLKAIMHDWKAGTASAEQMLAGRGAYDSAEMSRILQAFISDSQALGARASGARDATNNHEEFALRCPRLCY